MHGLIFETSICYWQDQPGISFFCRRCRWPGERECAVCSPPRGRERASAHTHTPKHTQPHAPTQQSSWSPKKKKKFRPSVDSFSYAAFRRARESESVVASCPSRLREERARVVSERGEFSLFHKHAKPHTNQPAHHTETRTHTHTHNSAETTAPLPLLLRTVVISLSLFFFIRTIPYDKTRPSVWSPNESDSSTGHFILVVDSLRVRVSI
jgi:hypothetical protein